MKRSMPLFLITMALLLAFGVLLLALPARDFSELENRTLAPAPAADVSSMTNGAWGVALESYAADHFPLRDALISARTTLHLLTGDARQQGSLAGRGGWLFEEPPESMTRVASLSVSALDELTEALQLPGALMLIPTSAEVMGAQLPALYTCDRQQPVIEALYAIPEHMTCVDAALSGHTGDGRLYYRTDHHLTAEGAAVCFEALRNALGLGDGACDRYTQPGFLGSYFARMPSALIAPETFTVDLPRGVTLTLDGKAADIVDEALLQRRNKYAALFGGTYAHAVLENPAGEGSLLLICDSYANAIAPRLSGCYARVDMVDMRYFTGDIAALTEEAGTTQLLAIFGLNTISANRSLLLMDIP